MEARFAVKCSQGSRLARVGVGGWCGCLLSKHTKWLDKSGVRDHCAWSDFSPAVNRRGRRALLTVESGVGSLVGRTSVQAYREAFQKFDICSLG